MGTFFAYSIQSATCLAVFYLFYKVLLSRETFHRFNRVALLSILILSFLIPFALTLFFAQQKQTTTSEAMLLSKDFFISDHAGITEETSKNKTGSIILSLLLIIYLSGCALFIAYSILSISRIIYLINKGQCTQTDNGTKLIILDDKSIAPFSWMKHIVLSKSDFEEAGDTIIAHESAHIRLNHTHDLLIAQICILTQWFNPAAWLLYQELQNIHEYEADEDVIRKGINAKQYQLLLIKKAVGTRLYSMANSFNHSNLKKRITMMLQKKSNPWARLKYAYVLPLAATTVAVFAHPEISQSFKEISSAKISHFALETSTNEVKNLPETHLFTESQNALEVHNPEDTTVYVTVERMPEYPGGDAELLKFIASRINYPENAAKNKIEGRVPCSFVVEKDGSITNIRVNNPVDPDLDNEAIRVIKELPKFRPGEDKGKIVRVKYTIPVRFKPTQ